MPFIFNNGSNDWVEELRYLPGTCQWFYFFSYKKLFYEKEIVSLLNDVFDFLLQQYNYTGKRIVLYVPISDALVSAIFIEGVKFVKTLNSNSNDEYIRIYLTNSPVLLKNNAIYLWDGMDKNIAGRIENRIVNDIGPFIVFNTLTKKVYNKSFFVPFIK